ncbi:DUF2141 domain-containing protein [bacterium]|nr:DUF2141 domain-containing protein [bacterium]
MKLPGKASILFVLSLFGPLSACCQYRLTIEIGPLKNDRGKIIFSFMDENKNIIRQLNAIIEDGKCSITLDSLKAGKYAFRYIHDDNNNDKLDTKLLFIPREGYGFSNNAKGKFGPPAFEDTIFELVKNDTVVCEPVY